MVVKKCNLLSLIVFIVLMISIISIKISVSSGIIVFILFNYWMVGLVWLILLVWVSMFCKVV